MNSEILKVEVIENEFIISFYYSKRINSVITDQVKEQIIQFLEMPNSRVILNLDGINFIDNYSFNALKELYEIANINDNLIGFANISEDVRELIDLVELDDLFKELNLN